MRFLIPNQTRRNLAASRLKREGYDVYAVPTPKGETGHLLDVFNVEDGTVAVEKLISEIAPDAARTT
jgi:hypothetical protein